MASAAFTAISDLDAALTSPTFFDDPYPVYAALRERDPVHWCAPWDAWVVTAWDPVVEVLRRPESFSSAGYELAMLEALAAADPDGAPALRAHYATQVLSLTDPPVHTRLRRSLVTSFTPRVVERLRPRVEALVTELLDGLPDAPEVDLLATFAYPLPALIIGELLGVPPEDQHRFTRWSADIVALVGTGAMVPERVAAAERSMAEFHAYLRPLIDARRDAPPGEDLLGGLVHPATAVDRLSDAELVATCVTLLFAGHETTANLIANGLIALLRHPDQLARLRAQPHLAPSAVEELLRFDASVQRNRRRAVADVELAGRRIRAGDRVLAFLGAANRDPAAFPEPERLDLGRTPNKHLAFGHGIHYCVGAALSRLEAPIALTAVLERFPGLALGSSPIAWMPNIAFRGPRELVVRIQ
jgi:cytochrome P450